MITTLAKDPTRGDVMQGTGGVRKLRIATGSRGKSGGARVIYYFYNRSMPVFLLSVYAKNEQANLSKATRNEMGKLVRAIVETYGELS